MSTSAQNGFGAARNPSARALRAFSLACALLAYAERGAYAQDAEFELPPEPSEREPIRAGEVHIGIGSSLYDRAVCPEGARCVLGAGGGFGFTVARRWPSGLAFGLGYDAWFVNGGSVYELTTMQVARVDGRYLFRPARAIHPYVSFGGGLMTFGDTFRIDTVGPTFDVGIGLEIEITHALAFTGSLQMRGFAVIPYRTQADGVRRGGDPAVSLLAHVQIGLLLLTGP